MLICTCCNRECTSHEVDEGGIEEFWGAPVWHAQITDVSDCCNEEVEEDGTE